MRPFNVFTSVLRANSDGMPRLVAVGPEISILLPYKPPYDWEAMLRFFAARAITGLEVITHDSYSRVVEFDDAVGSIHITHASDESALRVTVRLPRLNVLPRIIARVRRQFDLGAEPIAIATALSSDPILAPLVEARPGMRVPGAWDGFEVAVRAVLGQQITVKAATRLATRVVSTLGRRVTGLDSEDLIHVFPRPEKFQADALAVLGMPRARAMTLAGIARAVISNRRLFDPRRDLLQAVAALRELDGIGEWTAQYIAMRAMGESDAFLAADVALRRKLTMFGSRLSMPELLARAERWRPWRAYAMLHLWMADADFEKGSTTKELCDALSA